MRIEDLAGRRVALLGLGADVRASIDAIVSAGPSELMVVDDAADGQVTVRGHTIPVVTVDEACRTARVLVRSPGFPRYLPELVAAREQGIAMTTPVDLFLAGLGPEVRTVLVTGTKGKSTTTDLIGRMARSAGLDVGIAGNLGIPVFEDSWANDAPIIVLEVSSYQASDLHHVPDIAVISSIAEDHLSWHGGLDTYLSDKLRVVGHDGRHAPVVIVPTAETRAREVLAEHFGDLDPVLVDDIDSDGTIPTHRLRNAALAARVVRELGGTRLAVGDVVAAASTSLPGRLDPVAPRGAAGGVLFVDDALASNPVATAAGLSWARDNSRDVIVILGGHDRGVSSRPLRAEAECWNSDPDRRLRAMAVPESGAGLARACGIELVGSVTDVAAAVRSAAELLAGADGVDTRTDGRPMVIFSPAAPTPPGSGNWETRSAQFRAAVEQLSDGT